MVPLHQIIDADEARQSRGRAQSRVCRRKCSGVGAAAVIALLLLHPSLGKYFPDTDSGPVICGRWEQTGRSACLERCSQLMRGTGQVATDFPLVPGRAPGSPLLSLQHGRCPPWPGPLLQTACCLAARFSYAILVGSKQGLIGPAQGKWGWVGPVRPGKAEGSRQWSTEASGLRA